MSKEEKKTSIGAVAKVEEAAKSVKHVPAKHVPAAHVLLTIDVLMDNLRRNHIENIVYPWEGASFEHVIPVRKATKKSSTYSK